MKTHKTIDRIGIRIGDNEIRASSRNVIPLRGANSEKLRQDTSSLKLRPTLQAVELTHELIAERARTIWMERGCSCNQDQENWREAEAQLKAEMGTG